MSITTVRDNLINTIAGKEMFLLAIREQLRNVEKSGAAADMTKLVAANTAKFLEINIAELKKILEDVEACCVD